MNTDKLEIKLKALVTQCRLAKSKEAEENYIIQCANEIVSDRWIKVSDRLPETNCEVLAYKSNGLITQMSFHAPFDSGKCIFQWWGFGVWLNQHRQVTHWIPIPEPPK